MTRKAKQHADDNLDTLNEQETMKTTTLSMTSCFTVKRVWLSLILASLALLTNCATQSPINTTHDTAKTTLPKTEIVSSNAFTEDTLFSLLTAELGIIRGQYELGLTNYVQQAFNTRDVNVVARATNIAQALQRRSDALELSQLWSELDPGSVPALQSVLYEAIQAEEYDRALSVAKTLAQSGQNANFDEIAINVVEKFDRSHRDKTGHRQGDSPAAQQIRTLNTEYALLLKSLPQNAELQLGKSVLTHALSQIQNTANAREAMLRDALALARSANTLQPQNPRTLYQEFRVLDALGQKSDALAVYGELVEIDPNNTLTRTRYARMLISHDIPEALEQFKLLADKVPDDADIRLSIALIELDQQRYEDAKSSFTRLIGDKKREDMAFYGLAEVAMASNNEQEALDYYQKVDSGQRRTDAIEKAARIIKNQSGIAAAIDHLTSRLNALDQPEEHVRLFDLTSKLYLEDNDVNSATNTLSEGITVYPDSTRLLFNRAMIAANQNDLERALPDFDRTIELAPNNATVLNAYGYTLLDQAGKIKQAEPLIRKAHALDPNNAAILDSLGWLEYKLGKLNVASDWLRQAFSLSEDAEIAAHYGEVLWQLGKKRSARKIWKKGLVQNRDNQTLINTLKRFSPKMLSHDRQHDHGNTI